MKCSKIQESYKHYVSLQKQFGFENTLYFMLEMLHLLGVTKATPSLELLMAPNETVQPRWLNVSMTVS